MSEIIIIDAPCGAGKTSWAIQHMQMDTETSYVYGTPFLDEIGRIRTACGKGRFREPHNFDMRKIDDFNRLLSEGANIAVTHSTFLNATPETLDLIQEGEYVLILDEVLGVVEEFNKTAPVVEAQEQRISRGDIRFLLDTGTIAVDADCRVNWSANEYSDSKYSEVERLSKLDMLFCSGREAFLCLFSPEIFRRFKKIYVLTYLFDGSTLKYYFDLFGISYTLASVAKSDEGYTLTPFDMGIDQAFRKRCKQLVTICDSSRLNRGYKNTDFSISWYEKNMKNPEVSKQLRDDLRHLFRREVNAKAGTYDILWTCPELYKDKVKGAGYTCVRQLTSEERKLPESEREEVEKALSCFLPLNSRATNDYSNRWALAYCYNMNYNPIVERFFRDRNVRINKDLFSVSCLIQWMFRSRIRNGEEIVIYLPSPRMRGLLQKWLDCEI